MYGRLHQYCTSGDSPARNCFPLRIIHFVSDVNTNISIGRNVGRARFDQVNAHEVQSVTGR